MPETKSYTTEVYCSLQVEGLHFWLECPIPEVDYIKHGHRHIFYIKAYKVVLHDDRDVEFIKLKHKILDYLRFRYYTKTLRMHNFGSKSCEMIAKELIDEFDLCKCDVTEDNENGAIVFRNNE